MNRTAEALCMGAFATLGQAACVAVAMFTLQGNALLFGGHASATEQQQGCLAGGQVAADSRAWVPTQATELDEFSFGVRRAILKALLELLSAAAKCE